MIGALNDGGTPRTITFQDSGFISLSSAATSLVVGTTVTTRSRLAQCEFGPWLERSSESVEHGRFLIVEFHDANSLSSSIGSDSTPTVNIGTGTLTIGSTDNLSSNYAGNLALSTGGTLIQAGSGTLTLSGNGGNRQPRPGRRERRRIDPNSAGALGTIPRKSPSTAVRL